MKSNETISAVNQLAHCGSGENGVGGDPSFGEAMRDRILRLHTSNHPPHDRLPPQEALTELLGTSATGYVGAKCIVRPYEQAKVSWPVEGFQPVDINSLLASELANQSSDYASDDGEVDAEEAKST